MQKSFIRACLILALFLVTIISCPTPPTTPPSYAAGDQLTFSADGVSFNLVYVTGQTFPTGVADNGTATVADDYWIGETEITYAVWNTVYAWATNAARGANIYTFSHAGAMGDGTGDTDQHPVTTVNWRDCMAWCNAATEWYNANTGSALSCVYKDTGTPIRDSRDANAVQCDAAVQDAAAKGFRLMTRNEWELAARWRSDATNSVAGYGNPWFTTGNSASGATADVTDAAATQAVAWYADNAGGSTHPVKTTSTGNALGLYDVSGNVWEWCFTMGRVVSGGGWVDASDYLRVAGGWSDSPDMARNYYGFRIGKTP